jgi:hypothetical protein
VLLRELAFPACYHDRGETISEYIHGGSRHVHQLIDAKQQKKWLDGQIELRGSGQHDYE